MFLDRATLSAQPVPNGSFPHAVRTFERTGAHEVAARIGDADLFAGDEQKTSRGSATGARRAPTATMLLGARIRRFARHASALSRSERRRDREYRGAAFPPPLIIVSHALPFRPGKAG
ncbi:hypothetical protein [Burkholderia latens]|uniref:hypothetical protein n=1 Tax=Burkholderia latens TaxID=488446 RepID=UPI00158D118A|nr:hypothetical protein [Burkholderia latens]